MSAEPQDGDTRKSIQHEIMNGWFHLTLNNGVKINVFAYRHTLEEVEEEYYEGMDWEVESRDEIDEFYTTNNYDLSNEKEYLFEGGEDPFCPPDICKFFNVKDCGDWDFNGSGENWCGIEDEDDNETRKNKFFDYKSKFIKLTSKEQFRTESV